MSKLSALPVSPKADASHLIPKQPYISREFLQLEKERLWPNVWLMACRESDVVGTGRFYTFDIGDESIIVVRDANAVLRAFHNVCQHRGRRLVSGCGQAAKFICKYHGWRWNNDGSNDLIIDQEDWGSTVCKEDVALKAVKVDTWGGWVFVHMNPGAAEPLHEYLKPLVHTFQNYRFENFGHRWARTVTLPCNWKVALDVFIEGYHAQTAHRQFNPVSGDNRWTCKVHGMHSMFHFRGLAVLGDPGPNIKVLGGFPEDAALFRQAKNRAESIHVYFDMLQRDTDALITERKVRATQRMAAELPADASYMDMLMAIDRLHREEGAKEGITWDEFSQQEVINAGMDWHIFPNIAFLPTEDGALVYRARPNGDDPDSCVFDIYSMERYPPGKLPKVQPEVIKDWREFKWPRIFVQDFENLAEIQAGIKSRGFVGGRANPLAELTCINFHRHVRRMVTGSAD
jgi:nitrite reductase/ring-hydroxylating ferredoxin subunit